MSNILAQLYTASDKTSNQLDEINTTLGSILAVEQGEAKVDAAERKAKRADRRRAEQRAKRAAGDRKGLFGMMGKKEKDNEKKENEGMLKGILGTLGGGILGILGGIAKFVGAKLLGAVTSIGGMLLGIIPKIFNLIGPLTKRVLGPLARMAISGIGKALAPFKGLMGLGKGALLTKAGLGAAIIGIPWLVVAISNKVQDHMRKQEFGGGSGGDIATRIDQEREDLRTIEVVAGRQVVQQWDLEGEKAQRDAYLKNIQDRIKEAAERKEERIRNAPKEAREAGFWGEPGKGKLTPAARQEIEADFNAEVQAIIKEEGYQFQKGGRVPTMLEPGEKVFAPGAWNAQIEMMNKMFPRFQQGGKIDDKAGADVDGQRENFQPGQVKSGDIKAGGSINFVGDGSGFTGELKFMDGSGKHVGSYGGISGVARTAGATQEQRRNQPGAYNPIPDGTYPIESPMGAGSAAIGSFGAWINNPSGTIGSRGEIFLHNDIGSDGTQGCVGVELGGSRGPNANTKKFIDLYDKVMPRSLSVNLSDSSGKRFGPGDIGGGGGDNGNTFTGGGTSGSIFDIGGDALKMLGGAGGFIVGFAEGLFDAFGGLGGGIFGDLFGGVASVAGGALGAAFGGGEGAASAAGESLMPGGGGGGNPADGVYALIASGEGDYNSVNRGTAGDSPGGAKNYFGKNLTDMTVGEVMQLQSSGKLFAAGKYQIIPTTMQGFVKGAGINMSDKYNAATQEKFTKYVSYQKRPAVGAYLDGGGSIQEAGQALAREFASVGLQYAEAGRARGESRYAGTGGNAASISPEEITEALKASRAQGLQTGGIVSGRPSASIGRMKEAQEMFAEMIAEAAIVDPVVIYEDAPEAPTVTGAPSPIQEPPKLPNGPSTVQAADYFFNLSLGGSLA